MSTEKSAPQEVVIPTENHPANSHEDDTARLNRTGEDEGGSATSQPALQDTAPPTSHQSIQDDSLAPSGGGSAPVAATGTSDGERAAEEPPADESTSSGESKKKISLKPTGAPEDIRPVPSIGSQTSYVPPVADGLVQLPPASDDEVEAEVARAIAAMGSVPPSASSSEPIEVPEKSAIDASIEAAIEEAMSSAPSASSEHSEGAVSGNVEELQPGQKLTGNVQSVGNDFVFVDFGLRLSGGVPVRQFGSQPLPTPGSTLEVIFDQIDETEGLILARLAGRATAVQSADWELLSKGQMVECVVRKTNKGGLEVTVGSLRGFIPASQIDLGYVENMESFVGRKITAEVTELKPEKKNLVLSRRRVLVQRREEQKKEALTELKADQVRTGVVKTIKDYGAFVDLGGVDGFLPISQMSWIRIDHPKDIIAEGQEIEVKVLSIDREKEKISLGMRQLTQNPWRSAETKYEKGSTVSGRVTRVEAFGAFIELEPAIEGLCHISELDHRRVKKVTEVLNVDDIVEVQVLEVDPAKKRISLSVKALLAKPEPIEKLKEEEVPVEKYERKRKGPLKGGTGNKKGSGLFGNPNDFGN